jgi:hypothetical protein
MPALARMASTVSPIISGWARSRRMRAATVSAIWSSTSRGSSTTNSSPSSRDTVSWARTVAFRRSAAIRSSSSPMACPYTSLTSLNPSRSTRTTAVMVSSASASVSVAWSMNIFRLPSSVSGSWKACRARTARCRLRSRISVRLVRVPMNWRISRIADTAISSQVSSGPTLPSRWCQNAAMATAVATGRWRNRAQRRVSAINPAPVNATTPIGTRRPLGPGWRSANSNGHRTISTEVTIIASSVPRRTRSIAPPVF